MDALALSQLIAGRNLTKFANEVLGMPTHPGQEWWFDHSTKPINVLKPANQWGKTTATAIKHIFHAICKPGLDRFPMGYSDRHEFRYLTLNFGKTYEVAKGVMEQLIDITEGKYLLADGTLNKSMLKGWAIADIWDQPRLPKIKWWNHSETLIRSYDGLGESFKRLRLAYVSGDECGDITELKLFLNGTLLPRLFFFEGQVDLVGTSQAKGVEYEDIAQTGEEAMIKDGDKAEYFVLSGKNNPTMAQVYQNTFMPEASIRRIEAIADPQLRKQIIYGQYVDWAAHLYTWEEINQVFIDSIPWNKDTGVSKAPDPHGIYIFSVDMAASEDETSCTCIRYGLYAPNADGSKRPLPHEVVFHKAWKGASLPLTLQYELIKSYFYLYRRVSIRTKFVYDAGSLGGKNAGEAFRELGAIYPFPPKGRSYTDVKAEGMGKVKEVLGRGRKFIIDEHGQTVDSVPSWGGIKASSQLLELRRQLEISSKDDDKIRNDQYTSFMQALHFIEARAAKMGGHTKAVSFELSSTLR